MKNGLKELNEIPGVWGSLVCNSQGEIVEKLTPPALNKATLENIARHLLDMIGMASEDLEGLNEVVLHYKQRKIFAQKFQQALLVVVCTPSIDIPLLRMSVNMVRSGWEENPKIRKELG